MICIVQVIEYATSEVVKEIPCENERSAERVERGVNINLNHDQFFTQKVENCNMHSNQEA